MSKSRGRSETAVGRAERRIGRQKPCQLYGSPLITWHWLHLWMAIASFEAALFVSGLSFPLVMLLHAKQVL